MIHVLITVRESSRFPGKNRKLAPYTIAWLLTEMAYCRETVKVYTVGKRSELPLRLPVGWVHIPTSCRSHREDVEEAELRIQPAAEDVMLLVQVTQPLREHGLLEQAVRCIREGHTGCVTATQQPASNWRMLNDNGSWGVPQKGSRLVADGQLYAWRPGCAAEIFNPSARHMIILTHHRWGMVDIDVPEDMPPGLPAMAAELLLTPMNQEPLVLKNRKVLLIGSGRDLLGRGLGARIDAGEWDVVVRCNHYYGSPEDVGTRTDLAVVRETRFEKTFIDEAPVCPVRVLCTNNGVNFPKELLDIAAREVGHREASIGIIAARWLLNCGARLSVMGVGHFPDGSWIEQKTYPDGTVDNAGFCDWGKENAWWERQKGVELL
ncbi:MAG: glycosyltransferase family 29 protein [Akkermansia sp.]|nr:glycosyltransferase family 29 protein [Akkermansia sp.]